MAVAGDVDAVLFDLGGVLVRLGGVEAMRRLAAIASEDEVWHRWLTCPWVRSFERGECSEREFAAGVVAEWGLATSPAEFLSQFAGWPTGPLPGAEELVREVRSRVPVAVLSNTNALHWEQVGSWELTGLFDSAFLSFELGMIKPDRDVFEHVAGAIGHPPGRVLFLDDNLLNVEQAEAVGFRAARAAGVDQARAALVATGLLAA